MTEFRFPRFKLPQPVAVAYRSPSDTRADLPCQPAMKNRLKTQVPLKPQPLPIVPEQDPGSHGDFAACDDEPYIFTNTTTNPTRDYYGQIYTPGVKANTPSGCGLQGQFPLVIIVHANGIPISTPKEYHLQYAALARHLTSHGFITVCINRGISVQDKWEEDLGDVLEETVHHLYTKHPVRHHLANSIAIIGHSSGGKRVIEHAHRIAKPTNLYLGKTPRNLLGVILLACTLPPTFSQTMLDNSLKGTRAFLGINVVVDTDFDAYGVKGPGLPMNSTFRAYDLAGKIPGAPDLLYVTKSMVFAKAPGTHFFQNVNFTRAYVTAFLHAHINDSPSYLDYLKHQKVPPSIVKPGVDFFQLHENWQKINIAQFEGNDTRLKSIETLGVSAKTVTTYIDDEFSPHDTNALRIDWDRSKPPGSITPTLIKLALKTPLNVQSMPYLGFRIGQGLLKEGGGTAFDVRIRLNSGKSLLLSSYGRKLIYPIYAAAPIKGLEQTKSAMQSYLIPLEDFAVNLGAVEVITFDFGVNAPNSDARAIFYLDTIEFTF